MAMKIKHNGNWITIPTSEGIIKVKYAELKALIDASALKPGSNYQITDFCSSILDNDTFGNGYHFFDVLVYAKTANKLGAYAKALPSSANAESVTYFANCDLNQWILKYDINGNYDWISEDGGTTLPTRFAGTITYMKDDLGNEAPYDFKNVLFTNYDNSLVESTYGRATPDPDNNLTYAVTGGTTATLKAMKCSGSTTPVYYELDGTTYKIKKIISADPVSTYTVEDYQSTGRDYPYIKINGGKIYEKVAAKNININDAIMYAWVDDDGVYAYTTDEVPTTSSVARIGFKDIVTQDDGNFDQEQWGSAKHYTFGSMTDTSVTGGTKNTVIKTNTPRKFSYIFSATKLVNCKFNASCKYMSLGFQTGGENLKFKGNQYMVVVDKTGATEVVENYTFIANYGGTSTLSENFIAENSLSMEHIVGMDNAGNVVSKNPLSSTRAFYQRNEPLVANEGDLWFTIED